MKYFRFLSRRIGIRDNGPECDRSASEIVAQFIIFRCCCHGKSHIARVFVAFLNSFIKLYDFHDVPSM